MFSLAALGYCRKAVTCKLFTACNMGYNIQVSSAAAGAGTASGSHAGTAD